jgi:protoporphyrinogen oxidase
MKKPKLAVIGAGVSGLSVAHLLKDRFDLTVLEREDAPGGLIRCKSVEGCLFHKCGGHVFNTKYEDVLEWVKHFVDFDKDYIKADRNASIVLENGCQVPYPIENHIYYLDKGLQQQCIQDFLQIASSGEQSYLNFEDFLKKRFGKTLYDWYFSSYNWKVWRSPLDQIPLSWLEGKLPMPTIEEILFNNINHFEEKSFVHSSFWYPRHNGSQFFADRLAEGLDIRYNTSVEEVSYDARTSRWSVAGDVYDGIVFCGNIKELPSILKGVDLDAYYNDIESLRYHGTTSVFCEIDKNPYSWIYLPSREYDSHRIICTGNFSPYNNAEGRMTATVEFTDQIDEEQILDNLDRMPYHPRYLTHQYNQYTYPIQSRDTAAMIRSLKNYLSNKRFYMTGRFADWEYYNMDVAIKAAMVVCETIKNTETIA